MQGVLLLVAVTALSAAQQPTIQQAERLAFSRHFAEAERIYRALLRESPESEAIRTALARVLLWEGRYREARSMFLEIAARDPSNTDAAEGAATAAYWQGDFRTARREFRRIVAAHPDRTSAAKALHDLELASRGSERLRVEGIDDDQPYRLWRSEASVSLFSDPLTRWDVTLGGYRAENPTFPISRSAPFVSIGGETVLPWQRLTIGATTSVFRWPDGTTRPAGGLSLRLRSTSTSSLQLGADRRELLRTATAVRDHPAVSRLYAGWNRYAEQGWLGGFEAGALRYFDRNRGWYAQGYGLWPVVRRGGVTVHAGASAALRDTRDSRFYVEAISSRRSGVEFLYDYRGAYTPYWTPRRLREARAIVSATDAIGGRTTLKIQLEAGVARDRAEAFGPAAGSSPLPPNIFTVDFPRTFHPTRLSIAASMAIAPAYSLEISAERNSTVFYRANEFKATLVRRR